MLNKDPGGSGRWTMLPGRVFIPWRELCMVMHQNDDHPKATAPPRRGLARQSVLLLVVALLLPPAIYSALRYLPATGSRLEVERGGSRFDASTLPLTRQTIGSEAVDPPRITNVQILDFDQDGQNDVLACDAVRNRVIWYRQTADGDWDERVLCDEVDLLAPAHATVVDVDGDKDLDVLVSVLGNVWPSDERVGRLVWLENTGGLQFTAHVLLDDVRRVADVQAGDLDQDGDLDLVAAVFGFDHGHITWLEQREPGRFREHELLYAPGTIHTPIADYDGDGDLDVAAIVSQDKEELWGFENLGGGQFRPRKRLLYLTVNFDLGSAGLVLTDLDQDDDPDLLLSIGDNLEILNHYPQPYHGCIWFENRGDWTFQPQRIAHFGGTYAAAPGDLDGDGDLDVALVSMFNDWDLKGAASVAWLENDGQQNFRTWQIADNPIHLATVACGDLNDDGRDDIVAGGLRLNEPFDRLGRITAWISRKGAP